MIHIKETASSYLRACVLLPLVLCQLAVGAEWKQLPLRSEAMIANGHAGGDGFQQVLGISFAPSDPQRAYLSVDCAQVWRSDDGGHSWHRATNGFRANGGVDLAVDPLNEDVVYVAGAQGLVGQNFSLEADGVYRTLDGGESWERVLPAKFFKHPHRRGGSRFWIDSTEQIEGRSSVIYAAPDRDAVYRSEDGGDTWKSISTANGLVYDLQHNPHTSELWISTDRGVSILAEEDGTYGRRAIDQKTTGLPEGDDYRVSRVQFHPQDPSILYVLCGKGGVMKSVDGGQSFRPSQHGVAVRGKYASGLDLNPLNPDWLILSFSKIGGGNYQSFDGGESWQPFHNMDVGGLSQHLDPNSDPNSFYVGHKPAFHSNDAGIALIPGFVWEIERTEDGGHSWGFSGDGFAGARAGVGRTSFNFLEAFPSTMTVFCIDYGPFRSDDGGNTFRSLNPIRIHGARTTPVGAVHPENPAVVICPAGHWGRQQLIMTEDAGKSWQVVLTDEDNFTFMAYHPQDHDIIYAGRYRSDNGGRAWTKLECAVAAVDPFDGDVVYGIKRDKGETRILKSEDAGDRWTQLGAPLPVVKVNEIAVAHVKGWIYVPSENGVYLWKDGAWALLDENSGLPKDGYGDYAFRNILIHPENEELVFLSRLNSKKGHSDGLWCSTDGGENWQNITGNLGPEMTAWSMQIDPHTDRLYIGSSHGTWYLEDALRAGESNVPLE